MRAGAQPAVSRVLVKRIPAAVLAQQRERLLLPRFDLAAVLTQLDRG